jgi:branched-chain amino acid transport system ATP-binding protein
MAMLRARGVAAGYNGQPVVRDVDIDVEAGRVVALLGANGAGKTTTLLTLAGVLPPLAGSIEIDGDPRIASLHVNAKRGLGLVTEDRSIFRSLTVAENLRVARCDVDLVLHLFEELKPRMGLAAGLLSGGEQQMLSLGRVLARGSKLVLIDELSLGLAPLAVGRLLEAIRTAARESGVAALLVEQQLGRILRVADEIVVLQRGNVVLRGPAADYIGNTSQIEALYLSAAREVVLDTERRNTR